MVHEPPSSRLLHLIHATTAPEDLELHSYRLPRSLDESFRILRGTETYLSTHNCLPLASLQTTVCPCTVKLRCTGSLRHYTCSTQPALPELALLISLTCPAVSPPLCTPTYQSLAEPTLFDIVTEARVFCCSSVPIRSQLSSHFLPSTRCLYSSSLGVPKCPFSSF